MTKAKKKAELFPELKQLFVISFMARIRPPDGDVQAGEPDSPLESPYGAVALGNRFFETFNEAKEYLFRYAKQELSDFLVDSYEITDSKFEMTWNEENQTLKFFADPRYITYQINAIYSEDGYGDESSNPRSRPQMEEE